ncbi:MAG: hypothetical protein WCO56_11145 [Verrucomicrobiota bacterium]
MFIVAATHLELNAPLGIVALGVLLWLGAGWLSFLNWRRRGNLRAVGLLEGFRLLILLLVGFTLLKPEFVKIIEEKDPPEIAILMDKSASMTTRDLTLGDHTIVRREQWLEKQRTNKFWKVLEKNAKVSVEDMATPPGETAAGAAIREVGTDLNEALDASLQRHRRLKAVLMLTDGDWNLGASPVSAATRYRMREIPVYSVAVGSETPLPDLILQQVSAPAYGLLGEQVSIPFKIQSYLPREVKTVVTLQSTDGEEARKEVVIPAYTLIQDTMVWLPKALGDYNLRMSFPVAEGESLEDNNEQKFRIAIRSEKLSVLVIDSLPRWEYRYLRNALERDPGVEVNCLLYHPGQPMGGGTNYLKAFPETKEVLSKYDVVFLGDVGLGDKELTETQVALLKGLVEQQGSGLVFLPGARGRQLTLTNSVLADLLPVVYDPAKPQGIGLPTESSLLLTSVGRGHFLTMLANDEQQNEGVWKNLPGFYWCAGVLKSRAGSEVLAVHSALRNNSGRLPLLVTRPYGSGETLFMGTDAAWRWRRGVEDKYHYRFWGQVVRWMSHKRHLAAGQNVRLVFTPENPRVGDNVYLNATLFDAGGFPIERGTANAVLVSPTGQTERQELAMASGGWGVFKGGFLARESGKYKITISSDKMAKSFEAEILVARVQREKLGQPVNASVLREIADLTRAKTGTVQDLDAIVKQINALPELKPLEQRIKLWASPWWAGLLILLFGIYWTGRKLFGMI